MNSVLLKRCTGYGIDLVSLSNAGLEPKPSVSKFVSFLKFGLKKVVISLYPNIFIFAEEQRERERESSIIISVPLTQLCRFRDGIIHLTFMSVLPQGGRGVKG